MTNLVVWKAVAAFCLVPIWSSAIRRRLEGGLSRLAFAPAVALFAASRVVPCVAAFQLLRLKYPEDALEWARIVAGDLPSPYSPGFDGLLRSLWWLSPTPLALVLTMVTAEVAAFAVFWRVARKDLVGPALLTFWFVNPVSLFHITLGGQDEAMILLAWCGVLWAVMTGRPRLAGVISAFGFAWTKVLAGVAALPLLVLPARRGASGAMAGAVGVTVATGVFMWLGEPVTGFVDELNFPTSGNLWTLPEILGAAPGQRPVALACAVVAAAVASCLIVLQRTPLDSAVRQALRLTGTLGCVFMLCSPKSPTAWLIMFLPGVLFLILTLGPGARRLMTGVFLPVSAFEPSLWFYFDQGWSLTGRPWSRPLMLAVDAALMTGYGILIWHGLRLGRERVAADAGGADALGAGARGAVHGRA